MTGLFSKILYFFRKGDAMEKKTSISPPWCTLYSKFEAMFGDDPEIILDLTDVEGGCAIVFESRNATKLDALEKMLIPEFTFGNIKVTLQFKVSNDVASNAYDACIDALTGNPMFENIIQRAFMPGQDPDQVCVIMKKEIVQFFDDNLNDFYGNTNLLPTDITREIFKANEALNFSISNENPYD